MMVKSEITITLTGKEAEMLLCALIECENDNSFCNGYIEFFKNLSHKIRES